MVAPFERSFAGQRIMQIAYVTDDLERSVVAFSRTFGVLTWAAVRPVPIEEASLRGEPCDAAVMAAFAFQNDMMYEFIQPLDERPSIYRHRESNMLLTGQHHVALLVPDLAVAIARQQAEGYHPAMECTMTGGIKAAYVEHPNEPVGMIELIEDGPSMDAFLSAVRGLEPQGENVSMTIW